MTRTILVDGDLFAYQLACAEEKPYDFGEGSFVLTADAESGKANLTALIDSFAERLHADRIVVALSDAENFRHSVMPSYKSNRDGIRRPMILGPLKAHLEATYECFRRPKLEADDVLGILATNSKVIPGEKVVVTEDKDLRSVPGLHWNPKKEGQTPKQLPIRITEEEADVRFYSQVLSGDIVDGYSGCPGVGVVRAEEIVREMRAVVRYEEEITRGPNKGKTRVLWRSEPARDVWHAVVSHYEKAGKTEEDALQAARVARILRNTDYDFKNKEPILWSPKSR